MRTAALFVALAAVGAAHADPSPGQVEQVLKRDFHARGQATMERVPQDALQRLCTESNDRPPAALAKTLEADQMKTIAFPEGSLMGDWKRGERIAQGGRGMTWSDRPGAAADGSCYNCHQLSPKELSYGTIGPSLRGFGKVRGAGADMQRYVYGKIYNAKAYNLCSQMPRLGHSGTLTAEQIKDLVALLLDAASPVNQ
jgi:L-cysteine S-thiosulfotransferase